MISTSNKTARELTLEAGVAQQLALDVSGSARVCVVIENTGGSNSIDTLTIERSPDGEVFATDSSAASLAPIAAGADALLELSRNASKLLRLTLTSTSGTTARVTLRGT